jgi:hypothetical protein
MRDATDADDRRSVRAPGVPRYEVEGLPSDERMEIVQWTDGLWRVVAPGAPIEGGSRGYATPHDALGAVRQRLAKARTVRAPESRRTLWAKLTRS